jgi:hypothetical protein
MPREAIHPQPPEKAARRQREGPVATSCDRVLVQLRLFPLRVPCVRVSSHPQDTAD